ncbi:MAG: ATP-binding protein [Bacteroidales bacterium]|jgi:predicted AAA+ superfamily ATPase|nr:ATP-binding protein [Bacteroidales bacterium]
MQIARFLTKNINKWLFKGKAIVVVGPRQVGKTTLLRQILTEFSPNESLYLNCDETDVQLSLENTSSTELLNLIGKRKIVLIDEAQRVNNIGITLKLITDNIDGIQLLVSGSSALDIRNKLNEPLTGRKVEFRLFPLSTSEIVETTSAIEEQRLLEHRMTYGMYPDIVSNPEDAKRLLNELSTSYLYKDLLMYKDIRNPEALNKLLIALALQIGSEVSYNELSRTVGISNETVEKYIDLLEKVFIVFRQPSFSRNLRQELTKSRKIYFYDNGIRNALVQNFQPLALRNDVGFLWENFCVSERKKRNEYNGDFPNTYFWRTNTQQEIDYIEEQDGLLSAFEIKWNMKKKVKLPNSFADAYPNHKFVVVNQENYFDFIL